ncbi:MAG TPA: hypothetical protein VGO67_24715 [Verrucomicrobiae bacterium]|jgi:hypothetical protein
MGGLFLIIPVMAFDVWIAFTTGRQQFRDWAAAGKQKSIFYCVGIGIVLAVALTFFVRYQWGADQRVRGFPVPLAFTFKDGDALKRTILPGSMEYVGVLADFVTGLVAPLIPFKIAEFIKAVKAELK